MKNVILLTIDSLTAEALEDEKYGDTAMPFFKSLIKKAFMPRTIFSEGPHTEMGLQALLTGMHTLDNSASLRRLVYADSTIYDVFDKAGYKLAYIGFPSNYYPKRFYGRIEDYFTQGDSFIETIYWRLKDYVEYYRKGVIQEQDYIDLIGCFDDSFNSYLNFLNTSIHSEESYVLTKARIKNIDLQNRFDAVNKEYQRYCCDKRGYVESVLKNEGKLPDVLLVDDNDSYTEERQLSEKIKSIYDDNMVFFKKLKRKQIVGTIFDKRNSISKTLDSLKCYLLNKEHEYIGVMSTRVKQYRAFDICNQNRSHIDSSSLKSQFEFLINLLKNNTENKPYFIYLHSISQHDPTQWLSYDKPIDVIQEEIGHAKNLIDNTHNYNGYYTYRLGLKYLDDCLKILFDDLEKNDLLDNSIVVITADHGSSVCDNPIREEPSFNNCHSELFHIPLVICCKDKKPRIISGYYTHKDLIPTLIDICGLKEEFNGRGHSVLDSSYNPRIALSERTPSGAPTLLHKPAIYTVRNSKYLIEYSCGIFEPFENGKLNNVYDLKKDYYELNNLANTIELEKIRDLLEHVRARHLQLQNNYMSWLEKDVSNEE